MALGGWEPDELAGYEKVTLPLKEEEDGPLSATLVRRALSGTRPKRAILYIHGFTDYFFQTHVAEKYAAAEIDYYALDLRRYGRSLHKLNRPFQCKSLDDYFEEITWALRLIGEGGAQVDGLSAHSTGCLISSLYLHRGAERQLVPRAVFNSPFFEFRANNVEAFLLRPVALAGKFFPGLPAPVELDAVYGNSLHDSADGEWSYDLAKKPLAGYGVTCGWIRVIAAGHRELHKGLDLSQRVLIQHSARSHRSGKSLTPEDAQADIVLDVEHMKSFGKALGAHVSFTAYDGGLHDLVLSKEQIRSRVIDDQLAFFRKE